MASDVLSGSSNPTFTNPYDQNVRVVINFMYSDSEDKIRINWAGNSVTEYNIEAIGKNIACGSAFYGDYYGLGWPFFGWFFGLFGNARQARSALSAQNVAIKLPTTQRLFERTIRGWYLWYRSSREIAGFSLSIALPLEIYLSKGQTFSAICGSYNIIVLKEDGN
jgi:hypothetical protein